MKEWDSFCSEPFSELLLRYLLSISFPDTETCFSLGKGQGTCHTGIYNTNVKFLYVNMSMIAKFGNMLSRFYRTAILLVSRGPKQRCAGTRRKGVKSGLKPDPKTWVLLATPPLLLLRGPEVVGSIQLAI